MKIQMKQHFHIQSARFLPKLPPTHPCSRMHGHSFKISLILQGNLNSELGWLRDFNEVTELTKPVLNLLDHRTLNEIPGLQNPTSENLAAWIFSKLSIVLPELTQVTIAETADTECSYPALPI